MAANKRSAPSGTKAKSPLKTSARSPRGAAANSSATVNAGARKGGKGGVFNLYDMKRIAAGGNAGSNLHYANTRAALVEGKNVQVGLAFEKRGCGARPHTHPNEQFNFVVKGTLKVDVGDKKGLLVPAGSVAYFPANVVHRSIATPEEDVVFFVVKDLSHGISGIPVDQGQGGAHFEPEVRAARAQGAAGKSAGRGTMPRLKSPQSAQPRAGKRA